MAETTKEKIPEEIRHLDFDTEKKKKNTHFKHPIDPEKAWCGKAIKKKEFSDGIGTFSPQEVTCAECLHLYIEKGTKWYWDVHNTYYQSSCTGGTHNCGA